MCPTRHARLRVRCRRRLCAFGARPQVRCVARAYRCALGCRAAHDRFNAFGLHLDLIVIAAGVDDVDRAVGAAVLDVGEEELVVVVVAGLRPQHRDRVAGARVIVPWGIALAGRRVAPAPFRVLRAPRHGLFTVRVHR